MHATRRFPHVLLFLTVALASPLFAVDNAQPPLVAPLLPPGERAGDIPIGREAAGGRADTTWFGGFEVIDGTYYAISGASKQEVMWTFDRGTGPYGDPDRIEGGEGWRAVDQTSAEGIYFQVIDAMLDLGPGVDPPILEGERSLWCGADRPTAESFCWECGAGYGNNWSQRILSPPLAYDGAGPVELSFLYFHDAEECYDGTNVILVREDGSELVLNPYEGGDCPPGFDLGFTGVIGAPGAPVLFERTILAEEIGAAQEIRLAFHFVSDGGWSDEDCRYPTTHGPFGVDAVAITGGGIDAAYDFETGLQGWDPSRAGLGTFAGVAPLDGYTIFDLCQCSLSGNVLEMHDGFGDDGFHPAGQIERIESPICRIEGGGDHAIFLEFEMLHGAPQQGCLFSAVRWSYYPWVCEVTGAIDWSPPVGEYWSNFNTYETCSVFRYSATGHGVPSDAEMVIAMIYLLAYEESVDGPCTETTPLPLIDNLAVGVTEDLRAPAIGLDLGCRFMDTGSWPSDLFDPEAPGPANVARDLNFTSPGAPRILGDSLVVAGPLPGADPNSRWEAKLWWRVARRGPFQVEERDGVQTRYGIWKERVADGREIDRPDRPEFTWGWMDSVEAGAIVLRNKFQSSFREDDDDFAGEGTEENEMLWDDIFLPGTRIEYFVTANYVTTPEVLRLLPDTTGGHFYEFEILPGLRTARVPDCGGVGFDYCVFQPATLYLDAYNAGAQIYIENALASVLNGRPLCQDDRGCPIPKDRNWDRYDYLDARSNWNAPFARGLVAGSNNGMTLTQILGYRSILVNTGTYSEAALVEEDLELFGDWLVSPDCNANANRQVLCMNGDGMAGVIESVPGSGPAFLTDVLGASLFCDAFNGVSEDPDCQPPSESFCVRLLPSGGPFGTGLDVDAHGSGCPNQFRFDILRPAGTGVGNRSYSAEDGGKEADFAQIANEDLGAGANYRTILDGVSWHHVTARDPGGVGESVCPRDLPSIVAGAAGEIEAALRWGHDGAIPALSEAEELGACQNTWHFPAGVEAPGALPLADRLHGARPNPSGAEPAIHFSKAREGRMTLTVFDVTGRAVRTLVDGSVAPGLHSVVWDGRNDRGAAVGAGIYWAQMRTAEMKSTKRMVILK